MLAAKTEMIGAEAHNLKLTRPMVVAGVDLRAAVYDIQWDVQGTRATVTFSRKGRVVATVHGDCAVFDRSVPIDTLYISKHPDGFVAINALAFASTNKGIVFPLVRFHAHHSKDIPVEGALIEASWSNDALAVPRLNR
jgi:hypothetical protein